MRRVLLLLLPMALSLAFGALVAEGHFNLGGGEKDLLMVVPLMLWSIVYASACAFEWWRGREVRRMVARAAVFATLLISVLWLALAVLVLVRVA